MEVKIGGMYRHFKGNKYKVLNLAKCSETLKEFVVYETLYENPEGKIWIRPLKMFTEMVQHNGQSVPRFAPIES